jgi:disulfide oxidoreductase YuzD
MHPVAFRKAMIEAYLAGAEAMASGDIDVPSKKEAKDWFDNEYGQQESEECDCCEEDD